jgi:FkbM family methyltransferase
MISPLQLRRFTKFAYRHRGFARIAEKIRCRYSKSGQVCEIDDFDGRLRFVCDLSEHMASQIFWKGYYSEDQLRVLERILRPEMTFVDVGANHGEFTLFAALRLPQGRVISFEPASENYGKLKRNVDLNNLSNITMVQAGLGERAGTATIYRSNELYSDGTSNKGLHSQFVGRGEDAVIETITILRLDDYAAEQGIDRIDVMKIDIEGAELPALRGSDSVLRRFHPVIFLEVSESASRAAGYEQRTLLDHLAGYGYRFELIVPWGWGKTTPLDPGRLSDFQNVLCIPENRQVQQR